MPAKPALAVPALMVVFGLQAALAQEAAPRSPDDVMRILIEKAKEREALFDGFEATVHGKGSFNRGEAVAYEGRWVKSGVKFLHEARYADENTATPLFEEKTACDGTTKRRLRLSPGEPPAGVIDLYKGYPDYVPSKFWSPECLGITALPQTPGTLAELLEGDAQQFADKYAGLYPVELGRLTTRLLGTETIDGRECAVVETGFLNEESGFSYKARLYFDESLDYSCVRLTMQLTEKGELVATATMTLNDFFEAAPGLFIPARAAFVGTDRAGEVFVEGEYTVANVAFPAAIDDSLFALPFPAGTEVSDTIAGTQYTLRGAAPEEALREFEPAAIAQSTPAAVEDTAAPERSETRSSATADEATPEPRHSSPWVAVLAAFLVLAFAALLFARVQRRRSRGAATKT